MNTILLKEIITNSEHDKTGVKILKIIYLVGSIELGLVNITLQSGPNSIERVTENLSFYKKK